ncbi:hypothetical protein [Microbispora triticiradicis]|uniref:hypothetical protein n=1 Tax=Microbispora triticiradicis TaxID=2200763 RepID=UPI001AD694E8|nr:hypothetical protein [Microbispora triticiradicis]MBO4275735.1 hypothetical protein [Microbispora triticiradicis]
MPKFTKVLAGLALGTAIAGGAIAMSATAASAGCGDGLMGLGGMPCNNNTFVPFNCNNNNNCDNNNNDNCNNNNWCNNNQNNNFWNNQSFWNQSAFCDNLDSDSNFAIVGPCATIAFSDKTNRESNWFNNGWFQNNSWWNNNNCNNWNNNNNNFCN